ncbi:MAG: porin [Alphaproteobacteria bacterium]|nr:porin [Alphaproteobacteria bacterium]
MLKKSLSIIGASLLMTGAASATDLYNQDGKTFSVGGRVDMGIHTNQNSDPTSNKFDSVTGYDNGSRIEFSGTDQVNDDMKVFGKVQWAFDTQSNTGFWGKNRLGFAGIDSNKFGKITYGKQYSTYYDVEAFTDMFNINGGEANLIGSSQLFGSNDFITLLRPDSTFRYDKAFGGTSIGVQYTTKDSGQYTSSNAFITDMSRKYAFGASVISTVATGVKIGIAGNYVAFNDKVDTSDTLGLASGIAGVSYTSDMFDFALTGSYHAQSASNWWDKSSIIGQESYIAYKPIQPVAIYVGNNFQRLTVNDSHTSKNNNYTTLNYAAIGSQYSFNKSLTTAIEYRHDLRSKNAILDASDSNSSELAAVIKYNF